MADEITTRALVKLFDTTPKPRPGPTYITAAAAIVAAVVSWQPPAHASTLIANTGQPLTRADCSSAGLAWDENGNVCDDTATTETKNEAYWQRQYCAGMEIEKKLISGGRIDCFNDKFAIEVEWAQHWAEYVSQKDADSPLINH